MVLVVDQTLVMVSRSHGAVPGLVDVAAPDVDDRLAVEDDGDRRPDVGAGVEAGRQRRRPRLEARVPGAL